MKKSIAILLALAMAVSYCPVGNAAAAQQAGGKAIGITDAVGINPADGTTADDAKSKDNIEDKDNIGSKDNIEDKDDTGNKDSIKGKGDSGSKKEESLDGKETGGLPKQPSTIPDGKTPDARTDGNVSEISADGELEKIEGEKKDGEPGDSAADSMKGLQVPQRLEVVIDPWEMDGKTQIYSKEYIIENTGKTAGELTLSGLACKPQKGSGVTVRADKEGMHDNSDKSIYMEVAFQKGKHKKETLVLSQQKAEYRARLEPGEGLSISLTGEVNEYAAEAWGDNDVAVTAVYSWEEEMPEENDIDGEEEETPEDGGELESFGADGEEPGEAGTTEGDSQENPDTENPAQGDSENPDEQDPAQGDSENPDEQDPAQSGGEEAGNTGDDALPDAGGSQGQGENNAGEAQIETIDLQASEGWEITVDSWTAGKENELHSGQYVVRNTGETAGTLTLSSLSYNLAGKGGASGEGQSDTGADTTCTIEVEAGDRTVLSGELSGYKVELRPGEELCVRFLARADGEAPEDWGGGLTVSMKCSWDTANSEEE